MSTKIHNTGMIEGGYRVLRTPEFDAWFEDQHERLRVQIAIRIEKIQSHEYFGDHKSVSDYETGALKNVVWELRWKDGKRLYYAYIPERRVLLLLGGNKNGQDKDVSKAKNICIKATKISQKKG